MQYQAGAIEEIVVRLVHNFEDATLIQKNVLNWIHMEVKEAKRRTTYCRAKLASLIHSNDIHFFLDKVMAGWLDTDLKQLDMLATSVGLEVLGVNDSLIGFSKTEMVDSLKTILEFTELKISEQYAKLLEKVDKQIKVVFQTMADGKPISSQMVHSIVTDLNAIAAMAKASKDALTSEYYPLREQLSAEGKRFDRLQAMKAQRLINVLYFLEHFVSQYAVTFSKTMANF